VLKRLAILAISSLSLWAAATVLTPGRAGTNTFVGDQFPAESSPYVVDGLALGGRVEFQSQVYRRYRCGSSEQFAGLTWCQKQETKAAKREEITLSNSILHRPDGTTVYINRYIEPALLGRSEVRSEIDKLSAKYGEHARELWMPQREGLPSAVIAIWGQIQLQQLDTSDVAILASGGSPHRGILVGFLSDLERSAKAGVPVYRIAGGGGFIWAATFNNNGRGVLRFLAIDASKLAAAATQPSQVDDVTEAYKQFDQQWQVQNYAQAEPLAQKTLAFCERRFGQNNIQCAWASYNLALVYYQQGKYAQAEPLYQTALTLREQALGAGHPDVAATRSQLALVHRLENKYAEAEALYERTLTVLENLNLAEDPAVIATVDNLASAYQEEKKFDQIAPLYRRILVWRKNTLGPAHPAVAATLDHLKIMYHLEGLEAESAKNYAAAESTYRSGVAIFEDEEGFGGVDVGEMVDWLVAIYKEEKKFTEAEGLCRSLMNDRIRTLAPDDISVAAAAEQLAAVYKEEKKYPDAEVLYRRAIAIREKKLGLDDPALASVLFAMGEILVANKSYAEAERHYARSLKIREVTRKPASGWYGDMANTLNALAGVYKQENKVSEEEALRKRKIALTEEALSEKDSSVFDGSLPTALNELADMYERQGHYSKAIAVLQRVLGMEEQHFGTATAGCWIFCSDPLQHLADLDKKIGWYHEAYYVHLRRLQILQREIARREEVFAQKKNGVDSAARDLSDARNGLVYTLVDAGKLLSDVGRYDDGLKYFQRALNLLDAIKDEPFLRCGVLVREIETYDKLGRTGDATGAIDQLVTAYNKDARSIDHLIFTGRITCFGVDPIVTLTKHHQYEAAERILGSDIRRSLQSKEKRAADSAVVTLLQLGAVCDEEGRYEQAEEAYKRALEISKSAPSEIRDLFEVIVTSHLLFFYRSHGHRNEADELAEKVLKATNDLGNTLSDDFKLTLRGFAYQQLNMQDNAEKTFTRLIPRLSADSGLAATLDRIAFQYKETGASELALSYSRRALQTMTTADLKVSNSSDMLAALEAPSLIEKAGEESGKQLIDPFELLPLRAYRIDYFGHYLQNLAYDERSHLERHQGLGREALEVAQRAHNSSSAAALHEMVARFGAGNGTLATLVRESQDLVAFERDEDKKLTVELAEPLGKQDPNAIEALRNQITGIEAKLAADAKRLEREFPDYAALASPKPLKVDDVQVLLGDQEALVFCLAGETESYVFAVTRDAFDWRVIPLGGNELAEKVAAFRDGLSVEEINKAIEKGKGPTIFDLGLANALYATLLGPVEELIKDKKQLLIVPSGALTALPFNLLVTEKPAAVKPDKMSGYRDAAWLIKRQAVTVLPSIASLKALRAFAPKEDGGKPLIGFGDPVFNPNVRRAGGQRIASSARARDLTMRSYTDFWRGAELDRTKLAQDLKPLPDTAIELQAVAKDLGAPPSDIHLGKDASETLVKSLPLGDYRVVYFATHALVAGDVKGLGEPALALSIPAQSSDLDDGLLTASEVAQLKLDADWVVLSACNTAAGDKPGAEALSGLARAFFYAGARALLVSHWAVATDAAARLTTKTFDILKANPTIGRAEALRRAELDYLNDASDPRNAYPAFWAPFEIVGEGATR
jgi:CHAT domain-containing protein/Tfp pilus assembly protein PilF